MNKASPTTSSINYHLLILVAKTINKGGSHTSTMNDPTNDRFGELSTQTPIFFMKITLSKQEKCHWLILLV